MKPPASWRRSQLPVCSVSRKLTQASAQGADPTLYLQNLARDLNIFERLRMISLGQGQGPIAEALIVSGRESGDWVCLQVSCCC